MTRIIPEKREPMPLIDRDLRGFWARAGRSGPRAVPPEDGCRPDEARSGPPVGGARPARRAPVRLRVGAAPVRSLRPAQVELPATGSAHAGLASHRYDRRSAGVTGWPARPLPLPRTGDQIGRDPARSDHQFGVWPRGWGARSWGRRSATGELVGELVGGPGRRPVRPRAGSPHGAVGTRGRPPSGSGPGRSGWAWSAELVRSGGVPAGAGRSERVAKRPWGAVSRPVRSGGGLLLGVLRRPGGAGDTGAAWRPLAAPGVLGVTGRRWGRLRLLLRRGRRPCGGW